MFTSVLFSLDCVVFCYGRLTCGCLDLFGAWLTGVVLPFDFVVLLLAFVVAAD